MSANQTSAKGILEIFEHEGVVPAPYFDSANVLTFGVGHTANAGGPDPRAMRRGMPTGADLDRAIDYALEVFARDIVKFEARVNEHVRVPLAQHEFDALTSFDFNTGGIYYWSKSQGRHLNAKLVQALNAGDREASKHFFGWLKPPELRKRRTAEKNLFDTGNYDANGDKIPVWNVDTAGNLRGIHSYIKGADLLARMKAKGILSDRFEEAEAPRAARPSAPGFIASIIRFLSTISAR